MQVVTDDLASLSFQIDRNVSVILASVSDDLVADLSTVQVRTAAPTATMTRKAVSSRLCTWRRWRCSAIEGSLVRSRSRSRGFRDGLGQSLGSQGGDVPGTSRARSTGADAKPVGRGKREAPRLAGLPGVGDD